MDETDGTVPGIEKLGHAVVVGVADLDAEGVAVEAIGEPAVHDGQEQALGRSVADDDLGLIHGPPYGDVGTLMWREFRIGLGSERGDRAPVIRKIALCQGSQDLSAGGVGSCCHAAVRVRRILRHDDRVEFGDDRPRPHLLAAAAGYGNRGQGHRAERQNDGDRHEHFDEAVRPSASRMGWRGLSR